MCCQLRSNFCGWCQKFKQCLGGETELLNNQNHVPTSVVDMCKKLSKNVSGGEIELLKNQVQEVKALGGGRWRGTRHKSTKQTDIEFAMNQVDLE